MLTHSEGKPFSCDVCGKKFRTESYVKVSRTPKLASQKVILLFSLLQIHRQAHYINGQTLDITKRKSNMPITAPPAEGIHVNGEGIHANGEGVEDGEDDGKLIIDSNGGSSSENGNETESSEGMTTNPGSNEEAPRTPERECFLDPEDSVMMNGSFHISPVA